MSITLEATQRKRISADAPARRRRVRLFGLLLLVGALIVVAVASYQLLRARQHLMEAANTLAAADLRVRDVQRLSNGTFGRAVRQQLAAAQSEAAAAKRELWMWGPLLSHMDWVPAVGSELVAAPHVADALYSTSDAGLHLLEGLGPVWDAVQQRGSHDPLLVRLAPALLQGRSQFLSAQASASVAAQAIARVPHVGGESTLERRLPELLRGLNRFRHAARLLAVAPGLLGMYAPEQYLFCWQNPAELRATGGFIGAVELITLDHGRMTTHFTSSELYGYRGLTRPLAYDAHGHVLPHEITSVPPPLPESFYTNERALLFRDSNFSPDFPLSARLERWFYGEDTGHWVTGVIDFVDSGVTDILRATGAVYLPGFHVWVNARNAHALAQRYINGSYYGPLQHGAPDTIRKQFFGAVMEALMRRLQHLPTSGWPAVAAAFSGAIAHKDILLYDRRPSVESIIVDANAAGTIGRPRGDYLFVVDDNRGFGKVNPYVHEWASYHVTILPNLWLDSTLTLHYHVDPSPANLEGEPASWRAQGGTKHDYTDFLRVIVPRGAVQESTTGMQQWSPAPAYGLTQFAGRVFVREGHASTVTIRYSVPANVFEWSRFHSYSLTLQRQPGGNLTSVRVTIQGVAGVHIVRKDGVAATSSSTNIRLVTDARITRPIQGTVRPQIVRLPPAQGPIDPYIPFSFISDPHHHL